MPRPLSRFSRNLLIGITSFYLITIATLLVLTDHLTTEIFTTHLRTQVDTLIKQLPDNGTQEQLIQYLSEERSRLFFRVTLLDKDLEIIYESQNADAKAKDVSYLKENLLINQAMQYGVSYDEHFSSVTFREMAYIALRFEYSGQPYILRSSFPLEPMMGLEDEIEITFIGVSSIAFLMFGSLIWLLIRRLNRPLENILQLISQKSHTLSKEPVQEAPIIEIEDAPKDFDELIFTMNHLSENVNTTFRSLMRERNEKDTILNSMIEGVISLDDEFRVNYMNPSVASILELHEEDVLNQPLQEKRFIPIIKLLNICRDTMQPIVQEDVSLTFDTKQKYIDILVNPHIGGDGFTLVLRDQTPQHELSEMRKAFVANASHELRTPITIIRGFAETLHDYPDISKEILKDVTGKIVSNCERMVTLITNLMSLSKAENLPNTTLSHISIQEICEDITHQLQNVYPEAQIKIHLETDPLPFVPAEGELIRIALNNLIENGLKYCNKIPEINIFLKQQGKELICKIKDNGIGIPQEDLPYIFERFYRVDKARTKKTGGFGLGLSLVKTIIDKHGGLILVDSTLNEGTIFTIHLKLK